MKTVIGGIIELAIVFLVIAWLVRRERRISKAMRDDKTRPRGWYDDPTGKYPYRWWTGRAWAANVQVGAKPTIDPDWH